MTNKSAIMPESMEYNTERKPIVLMEYGRNVEKIIARIKEIPDKEKRTQMCYTLVDLMKQVMPTLRDTPEITQKMWDDIHILSNFELDIDGPYPVPEKELLTKKPNRMPYQSNKVKFKHYGRNLELLVLEALQKEDPKEREDAIIYIGKLMKSFYTVWNKEMIDDAVILENIKTISNGQLDIDLEKVKEDNLFEKLYKEKRKSMRPDSFKTNQGNGPRAQNRSNFRKNNDPNRRRRG
jgi:hypothetical protein